MLRTCVAAALLLALPAAGEPLDAELGPELFGDDECGPGEGEACSLNQIQLRAGKAAAAAAADAGSELERAEQDWSIWPWNWFGSTKVKARDHPLYCDSLPAGAPPNPWCTGAKTCQCVPYCMQSVRPQDWGWDPNCCGCTNIAGASSSADPAAAAAAPALLEAPRPSYCRYGADAPACAAEFAACTCGDHCLTDVAPSAWNWDASCCGCGAELLQAPAARTHPLYCDSMPNGGQASPWCSGASTCGCEAYCLASVPPSSRGWDPNCCGCGAGGASAAPAGAAPAPPGALPTAPLTPNVTEGGLSHPKYCQQLPMGTTSIYCQGASTCGCQTYCTLAVLPSQWGWDPNCCGCGTSQKTIAQKEQQGALVPQQGLKHPAYCENLPAGASPYCAGADSCKCQAYCLASVVPSSWRWDPQCCGCTEAQKEQQEAGSAPAPAPGAAPGAAAGVAGVPRDQPTYCAVLPPYTYVPWCAPGVKTCSCQAYCTLSVAAGAWGTDPNCCGCSASAIPVHHAQLKPQYCASLPATMALPWCMYNSCTCQPYCSVAVSPSQWAWDPQCCGCEFGAPATSLLAVPEAAAEDQEDEELQLLEDGRWRRCAAYAGRSCSSWGPGHTCRSYGARKCVRWWLMEQDATVQPVHEKGDLALFQDGRWRRCRTYGARTCSRYGPGRRCSAWGARRCTAWWLLQQDAEGTVASRWGGKPGYCQWLPAGTPPPPACRDEGGAAPSGCGCDSSCSWLPSAGQAWNPKCCGCKK